MSVTAGSATTVPSAGAAAGAFGSTAGVVGLFACSSATTWAVVTPSGIASSLRSLATVSSALVLALPVGSLPTMARTGRNSSCAVEPTTASTSA
ncbi:unannotated protein [freshwater metagenome]|uniref:Unannotated protein n=1 Tax=freshwater metagenome TaxID=449393 RepID=A0A6J6NNT0_9ZZZZ